MSAITADPRRLADDALRALLETQRPGLPGVTLDSPPGAGKTGAIERVAVQELGVLGRRCLVATGTNEQAQDLARRLASGWPTLPVTLFVRRDLALPPDLAALPNLRVARDPSRLPAGAGIVIATAARLSWLDALPGGPFSLLCLDEAYQQPDYRFHAIAGLAERVLLVGDPGQLAPVITAEVGRWRAEPAGPQVAAPHAFRARYPEAPRLTLPVSRRLPPDTVAVVQPAFYPDLPFVALARPGERRLALPVAGCGPLDPALDLLADGASLGLAELPALPAGEVDEGLAEALAGLAARLLERGATVRDEADVRPLTPADIGIACAHVRQVQAVQARLPVALADTLVETADRWQGLERPVMLVHHPLSGRAAATSFGLAAGRLCVLLSRHRVACLVLARAGLEAMLTRAAPIGERVLGLDDDPEWRGWQAHRLVLAALRARGRIVPLVG